MSDSLLRSTAQSAVNGMPRLGTLFVAEPQQRRADVRLVVRQRLGVRPDQGVVETTYGKARRRPARRDGLPRLVHRLGDLAQRAEPVRTDAGRQIRRGLDRLRHVGEGGLEQNTFTHWDGVLGAFWMTTVARDVIWCISGRCQQYIGYIYCYRTSQYCHYITELSLKYY